MYLPDLFILLFLIAGAAASAHWKKLTPIAALTGGLIGWAIYSGDSYRGLIELALFFILGTTATAWKKKEKSRIKDNAAHQSTRTTGQVIANGGMAAIMGVLMLTFPAYKALGSLMLAASLSSATADTLSSELGMVYGRRCYNILTWKKEERGPDGVISLEGLLLGTAGSAIIAAVFVSLGPQNVLQYVPQIASQKNFLIIILAGLIGNLADSILGALLERRKRLTNDQVNFLNTLIAAASAAALACFHR